MRKRLIRPGGWRCGTATLVAVMAVCAVFLAGPAFGQCPGDCKEKQPPADEPPKIAKTDAPPGSPTPPTDEVPAPQKPACGEREPIPGWADQLEAVERRSQGEKPTAKAGASGQGGKPKWACEKETIVVPPVWAGEPLVCRFGLRNEGDADLIVKLRTS